MYIEVLCQSNQVVSRKVIIEFVQDGVYFENEPCFVPNLADNEINFEMWNILEIHYQSDKKPILIERLTKDLDLFAKILEEKIALIRGSDGEAFYRIVGETTKVNQIFCLQFDEYGIDENAWAMLDSLEVHLCKQLDGLFFADDGVFDKNLRQILTY